MLESTLFLMTVSSRLEDWKLNPGGNEIRCDRGHHIFVGVLHDVDILGTYYEFTPFITSAGTRHKWVCRLRESAMLFISHGYQ